jgi:ATP-dependent 26S proteasome regulatory subunit
MATAEQIKALIRSHVGDDSDRFYTLALQVAAHEAQQGHSALAHDIRGIVDKARQDKRKASSTFPQELEGLVQTDLPGVPIAALVLPEPLMDRISKIKFEYLQRDKLAQHGLKHRRKILLTGPPGTGKTLTARALSHELKLPLYTVQVDRLVTKFMGETSARLRQIFELIHSHEGVYLFDEFDSIGGGRNRDNDVGEMRRVLTSLLQFIEQDSSDSIIVAATNSPELLDRALFRRFDDVLNYTYPDESSRQKLIQNALTVYIEKEFKWSDVLEDSNGLSSAEIVQACLDTLKDTILRDRMLISSHELQVALAEKHHSHGG